MLKNVTASKGWFHPFRSQYELINVRLLGKSARTNMDFAVKSAAGFQGFVKAYGHDDNKLYNAG